MKKLFFAAAVAVVAVGAALSSNAITIYAQGSDTPIVCENLAVSCSTLPQVNYYETPFNEDLPNNGQTTVVQRSQFEDLKKAN
ncbi:hypothetical protein [Pedobacter heparinus]|uniref:Uncharacterized protein n=1 Tax=Pedobacter heparinus (strain ATCC 13125 / DSM 2366 / CIP 104194 / JCM 7457 / NBRC 12017 / NCIMB 9290 / NRRL B-14731 / HIM 762-3) TaxID=485917 RepID=C6XUL7_PEDHD|nr:hypothetical protein [Pedobacter heparinus]ACU03867.1 hypothetical protein Phep_1655 [Pedobacter heparinus DSM 2366]